MSLQTYVRKIVEAALTSSDAESSGLALCVVDSAGTLAILYNVSKMKDALWHHKGRDVDAVVGMIHATSAEYNAHGPSYGGLEIVAAAAEKGYGPLLYDFALSLGKPIMPDRESVSKKASAVWDYFYSKRSDVKKLRLDNKYDPKTPDPYDDSWYHKETETENPLNFAYVGQGNPCTSLIAAHDRLCETFERLGVCKKENFVNLLKIIGDRYFIGRYRHG